MGLGRLAVLLIGCAWLTGCSESSKSVQHVPQDDAIPYYSSVELKAALSEEDRLVLVEFCVPYGCARCDEMRPTINQLAEQEQGRTAVHRVDLQLERSLASRLGVTMCPSYVAFRNGKEVFRIAYPTSSDLIAAEIARAHQSVAPLQLSNQVGEFDTSVVVKE